MTFLPKPTRLTVEGHSSETNSLLLVFYLAAGLMLILLSAAQIKHHAIKEGISLFGAGFLAILSAAVLRFSAQFGNVPQRIRRCIPAVVALLWLVWVTLIAYAHRVEGWDEGSYVLSGMALRGYHVPYASPRAPVTGLLCAAFIGWERFLNPALLGLLLIAVYLWVRRLLGPILATLSLLVLLCQNLLLDSTVDITSELPAALLMLVGFIFLARERFWWSALWFALLVFTRWNLAPVWAVVLLTVLIRFGVRQTLKFLWVGLAIFSAWYVMTIVMRPYVNWPGAPGNPLAMVYEGNFLPALTWTANPEETPDFLRRVDFYVTHFFFLTPFVLFALIASPVQNQRKQMPTERWVILIVLPLASLAYLLTMLNVGGLFPRFVTPLIPSAVVCLHYWLFKSSDDRLVSEPFGIQAVTVAVFFTCAVGMWPLSALGHVRSKAKTPPVFSAELRKELTALDGKAHLNGIPRQPLSRNHANPAMAEVRHLILFPSARRDTHDGIIEEPESIESVHRLVAACHPGDLLLIPEKYASEFQAAAVLASDGQWALIRNQ